jgi:beta-glucosidase/6-phospho-beta-glucosidase/beta-galactosidase
MINWLCLQKKNGVLYLSFRDDFVWGTATAAYQIEGASQYGMNFAGPRVKLQVTSQVIGRATATTDFLKMYSF